MSSPDLRQPAVDLLAWPILGRFLKWRHARTSLQLIALAIAAVVILHGLFGPQIAPANLATVVTWVHYRGLLVLALLAAGNVFCTGCPFVLVRDAARRGRAPQRALPVWLRTKWVGIALFGGVLFVYELFDLWSLPRATAWLILGYFGAALAIDLVFRGAAFCKYFCPVGQFNFVASTLSPLEVTARDRDVCGRCRTADCVAGRRMPEAGVSSASGGHIAAAAAASPRPARVVQRGCELGLFLPRKVGNLDCTFCLDCVQACPHDNVAIAARLPGAEIVDDRRRSGIGRLAARADIAALATLFVFGALLNAFAMTSPVYDVERGLAGLLGTSSEAPVLAVIFVLGLIVAPAVLLAAAAWFTRVVTRDAASVGSIVVRYAMALVPFGFGMWLAHYAFHFLTGALTIVPVTQRAAADLLGAAALGAPMWHLVGMRPGAVLPIQLGFLFLGTIGALAAAYGISERDHPDRAAAATIPWAFVIALLAATAVWVLWQPMDMRGTGLAA